MAPGGLRLRELCQSFTLCCAVLGTIFTFPKGRSDISWAGWLQRGASVARTISLCNVSGVLAVFSIRHHVKISMSDIDSAHGQVSKSLRPVGPGGIVVRILLAFWHQIFAQLNALLAPIAFSMRPSLEDRLPDTMSSCSEIPAFAGMTGQHKEIST